MKQHSIQTLGSVAPFRFGQASTRVLYVGDHHQAWSFIRQFLRERPSYVVTETDTPRVLDRLLSWPDHLQVILCDTSSINCPGRQVLESVAKSRSRVPVVVLTAPDAEASAAKLVAEGAVGYVVSGPGVELRLPIAIELAIRVAERERELAHSRTELAGFFGLCREMLCTLSVDGRILQSNAALREMFGIDLEEAANPSLFRLVASENVLMVQELVRRAAGQTEPVQFTLQCRTRIGEDVWIDWNMVRSQDRSKILAVARPRLEQTTGINRMEARAEAQSRLTMLSQREEEILRLVVEGKPNKVIARRLSLSEKTVEKHRSHGMKKLHVSSVPDLVRLVLLGES
jgi:PAS domain S-box-containing protein